MHHLPRFFSYRSSMSSKGGRRKPRLDRRNAAKHIDYDATSFSSSLDDSSSSSSLITRSLDLSDKTSFRIQGTDGEFDLICRTLGLSGPEDFSIPSAAWEARKIRSSSSDVLPRSKLNRLDSPEEETDKIKDGTQVIVSELADRVLATDLTEDDSPELKLNETDKIKDDTQVIVSELADRVLTTDLTEDGSPELKLNECCRADRGLVDVATTTELKSNACWALNVSDGGGSNGIKGARPPVLKPPPVMKLQVVDNACSTWDLFRDFAPEDDKVCMAPVQLHSSSDEEEVKGEESGGNEENGREENLMGIGETATLSESCLYATSNDDDSSSSTTEPTSNISPNGRFKRTITYWEKGELLGRGSFGSVFEGISDDGFFFAVKEVSLLDQGSQGKQSIIQLEHEIALLSQFEHENIVQYYGTDKDDSKLYIFLELVTKGSLLNLYQRYHLRDSQVSAYTRQILHGLKYLHDQNVVHRDVKCANILVDASGSVKLADFGLAKATKLNDVKSCKGTAFWMAPEVVNQKGHGYGLPADIWSLGCTVLEMLTCQIPYYYLEHMQALFRIGRGEPPAVPDSLSKDARDFILQCLQVNPDARPTAAVLLQHPFVKRSFPTHSGSASPHIGRRF